jgi:hypothetical protein
MSSGWKVISESTHVAAERQKFGGGGCSMSGLHQTRDKVPLGIMGVGIYLFKRTSIMW